jgi:hypothetical protein
MQQGLPVIHQTMTTAIFPENQPIPSPRTGENIRLAGGRRAIFTLLDADYDLRDGKLHKTPLKGKKLLREMEIFPLVKLRSFTLGELAFMIFHPLKAWGEWRGRIRYKLGKR